MNLPTGDDRHANYAPQPESVDAVLLALGAEAIVGHRVGTEHAFLGIEDVIDNRL